MKKSKDKKVCVFGSYKNLSKKKKADIVRLGRLLAGAGFTVVSGGFGGTMEDISRGAKSAGGKTIGVTCYQWDKPLYSRANKFVDKEIVGETLLKRIEIMLKESDAFIVLPGGTGTLLELAAVLEYMNKDLMPHKPVIMLGDFWKPILKPLKKELIFSEKTRSKGKVSYCHELAGIAKTPEECVRKLELAWKM